MWTYLETNAALRYDVAVPGTSHFLAFHAVQQRAEKFANERHIQLAVREGSDLVSISRKSDQNGKAALYPQHLCMRTSKPTELCTKPRLSGGRAQKPPEIHAVECCAKRRSHASQKGIANLEAHSFYFRQEQMPLQVPVDFPSS